MEQKYKKYTEGFTIVELLVVLAILAVIGSIVFASFRESKVSSRNANRLSEITQVHNALGLYQTSNRRYPGTVGTNGPIQTVLTPLVTQGFIPALPPDPGDNTNNPFFYCPGDDSGGGPQNYALRAKLELEKGNPPTALNNELDGTIYGCDCSDANLYYCVSP